MAKVRKIRKDTDTNGEAQHEMFDESVFEGLRTERMFEVELSLSLKEEQGKADRVCLACTKVRGTSVEEVLNLALQSRRNRAVIAALLDNPTSEELEEAERRRSLVQAQGETALEA